MGLLDAPTGFALAAGSLAAFNPCGFAMLPAYLSFFLAADGPSAGLPAARRWAVARALRISTVMTVGFAAVFGLAGLAVQGAALTVGRLTPWFTVAIGVLLVPIGLAMLFGRDLKIRLPRMQRGGRDGGLVSMGLFGASYATVSLSCTLPVFLTAVSGSFRAGNVAAGMAGYLAYAAGMGLVVATLTVALALARDGLVRRLRRFLPHLARIGGGLVAVAGAYVAYYGWFEIRTLAGDRVPAGPVEWVTGWSGTVTDRVEQAGPILAIVVLAALVALGLLARRHTHDERRPPEDLVEADVSERHDVGSVTSPRR